MTRSITTKFAILMAAAAIFPLVGYGMVSMLSARSGAQQAVIQGNISVARQAAEQIEQYIQGNIRILRAVAADLRHTGLQPWQQDRILKNFALDFPEYTEITLFDHDGAPVATSRIGRPTVTIPGSDSTNIGGVLMSPFSVDDDLLPTAVLAVPPEEGPGGWLVARLNLEELWRTVDKLRVGEQGFALVVTSHGQLIAHGDPNAKSRVARGDSLRDHPLIAARRPARPEAPESLIYPSETGEMVGVAVHIASLDWTLIVEQPTAEAFAIPNRLEQQLAAAVAIALLVMVVAGYAWARSFIGPILRLTRGTHALAEGRFNERVEVHSKDELGQLAAAFNNMADRIVELQEDVRKKERVAMFGRIAVGLVHDLSHPIQNIGNHCKLIVRIWDDAEYRKTFHRTIERELALVKRVLDDLLHIARPIPISRAPIDVNKELADVVESLQAGAESSGLTLDTEFVFGPLYIEGDKFALNRVYRNLIVNAFQATPPHGRVIVRTKRESDHAVIEVADTGCGIPPERLRTIFDDFYTTKRRGLGLGLATSKKIIEQLGGTISVTSTVGLGSTFTLRFPLTKARPGQLAVVS